jgi:hypothetical protein
LWSFQHVEKVRSVQGAQGAVGGVAIEIYRRIRGAQRAVKEHRVRTVERMGAENI